MGKGEPTVIDGFTLTLGHIRTRARAATDTWRPAVERINHNLDECSGSRQLPGNKEYVVPVF